MENIFDIKFAFEKQAKENIIEKFSGKQGGGHNVFSFHWQCFAWAAIIGLYYNEKKELGSPLAEKVFNLNTMRNNDGDKIAKALLCMMCIAKAETLDILKDPNKAIALINEYANGGFYRIQKMIDNGEFSANNLDNVKKEIFER